MPVKKQDLLNTYREKEETLIEVIETAIDSRLKKDDAVAFVGLGKPIRIEIGMKDLSNFTQFLSGRIESEIRDRYCSEECGWDKIEFSAEAVREDTILVILLS